MRFSQGGRIIVQTSPSPVPRRLACVATAPITGSGLIDRPHLALVKQWCQIGAQDDRTCCTPGNILVSEDSQLIATDLTTPLTATLCTGEDFDDPDL
jgi:hypothetical protein